MSILLFFMHEAVHDVLLANLQDVVCQPIENESTLKIHEEDGHDHRHDHHHFLLGGISRCGSHLLADILGDSHQDWCDIEGISYREVFDPEDEGTLSKF